MANIQFLHALFESPQRLVISLLVVVDLGGYEDLITRNSACSNTHAYLHFVVVHRSRINQPIPGLQCMLYCRYGFIVMHVVNTQAEEGHFYSVVKGNIHVLKLKDKGRSIKGGQEVVTSE